MTTKVITKQTTIKDLLKYKLNFSKEEIKRAETVFAKERFCENSGANQFPLLKTWEHNDIIENEIINARNYGRDVDGWVQMYLQQELLDKISKILFGQWVGSTYHNAETLLEKLRSFFKSEEDFYDWLVMWYSPKSYAHDYGIGMRSYGIRYNGNGSGNETVRAYKYLIKAVFNGYTEPKNIRLG